MTCKFCENYCHDNTREDCPICGTYFIEEPTVFGPSVEQIIEYKMPLREGDKLIQG